jgi:hypothetical protein
MAIQARRKLRQVLLILISSRFGTRPMFSSAIIVVAWKHYLSYVFLNPPLCIHVKGVRIHQLLHIKEHSNCWPSINQCISICIQSFIHSPVYTNISSSTGRALENRNLFRSYYKSLDNKIYQVASCKRKTRKKKVKITTCSA